MKTFKGVIYALLPVFLFSFAVLKLMVGGLNTSEYITYSVGAAGSLLIFVALVVATKGSLWMFVKHIKES